MTPPGNTFDRSIKMRNVNGTIPTTNNAVVGPKNNRRNAIHCPRRISSVVSGVLNRSSSAPALRASTKNRHALIPTKIRNNPSNNDHQYWLLNTAANGSRKDKRANPVPTSIQMTHEAGVMRLLRVASQYTGFCSRNNFRFLSRRDRNALLTDGIFSRFSDGDPSPDCHMRGSRTLAKTRNSQPIACVSSSEYAKLRPHIRNDESNASSQAVRGLGNARTKRP